MSDKIQPLLFRHLLPAAYSAAVPAAVAKWGRLLHPGLSFGVKVLPAAGLGALAGIFYSATYHFLCSKTALSDGFKRSIAVLTSSAATVAISFAASSAGLFAMPTLPVLAGLIATSLLVNMLARTLFG